MSDKYREKFMKDVDTSNHNELEFKNAWINWFREELTTLQADYDKLKERVEGAPKIWASREVMYAGNVENLVFYKALRDGERDVIAYRHSVEADELGIGVHPIQVAIVELTPEELTEEEG